MTTSPRPQMLETLYHRTPSNFTASCSPKVKISNRMKAARSLFPRTTSGTNCFGLVSLEAEAEMVFVVQAIFFSFNKCIYLFVFFGCVGSSLLRTGFL